MHSDIGSPFTFCGRDHYLVVPPPHAEGYQDYPLCRAPIAIRVELIPHLLIMVLESSSIFSGPSQRECKALVRVHTIQDQPINRQREDSNSLPCLVRARSVLSQKLDLPTGLFNHAPQPFLDSNLRAPPNHYNLRYVGSPPSGVVQRKWPEFQGRLGAADFDDEIRQFNDWGLDIAADVVSLP